MQISCKKSSVPQTGSQPSAASSTQPRSFHDVIHTPSLLLVNADDDCLKLQKVAEIFDYPDHADEPCPVAVAALLTFFQTWRVPCLTALQSARILVMISHITFMQVTAGENASVSSFGALLGSCGRLADGWRGKRNRK